MTCLPPRILSPGILALLALCALPLLAIPALGHQPDVSWLLRSLLSLGLLLTAALWLSAQIPAGRLRQAVCVVFILITGAYQLARLVSWVTQGSSFNEQFFFHLDLGSLLHTGSAYWPLMAASAVFLGALVCCAWYAGRTSFPIRHRVGLLALVLALLVDPDLQQLGQYSYQKLQQTPPASVLQQTDDWPPLNLNPAALDPLPPRASAGKNLVLVYLESLERGLTDGQHFPGLTPNLNRLQQQGLELTNIRQSVGTSWTIAGIASSQCGTPLIGQTAMNGNDMQLRDFLGKANCVGDVLASAGYRQEFLGGANAEFAGKRYFLQSHGYDLVEGLFSLRQQQPQLPADSWGLYDEDLIRLAGERFGELAGRGQPFNLTVLTLDTHSPGRPSPGCPRYPGSDSAFLQAVHCSDHLVGQLVGQLSQHPAWQDTVLVIMSDHLAFEHTRQQDFPAGIPQRLLFTAVNAGQQGLLAAEATHMDLAPTLLQLLQVQHNTEFLMGRKLLTDPAPQPLSPQQQQQQQRYVRLANSQALTPLNDLCAHSPMLRADDTALFLGPRPLRLSEDGWPVPLSALSQDKALLGQVDDQGKLLSYTLVDAWQSHRLTQTLTLAAAPGAQRHLLLIEPDQPHDPDDTRVTLSLIHKSGAVTYRRTHDHWSQLQAPGSACQAMLSPAATRQPLARLEHDQPPRWCQRPGQDAHAQDNHAHWGADRQTLHLQQVVFNDQLYSAVLQRTGPGVFTLQEYTPLDTSPDHDKQDHNPEPDHNDSNSDNPARQQACLPILADEYLFIPRLEDGGQTTQLFLKLQPDTEPLVFTSQARTP